MLQSKDIGYENGFKKTGQIGEHTSELQSHSDISYAVFCLKKIFFFNDTATTEIYTLSLHDALPIFTYRIVKLIVMALCSFYGVLKNPYLKFLPRHRVSFIKIGRAHV